MNFWIENWGIKSMFIRDNRSIVLDDFDWSVDSRFIGLIREVL